MTPIETLRESARDKRDEAIQQAKEEYRVTVGELNAMARKLGAYKPRKYKKCTSHEQEHDFSKMRLWRAAQVVLEEKGSLLLAELALEVMRRGCRTGDDPRAVANSLRASFQYHEGLFSKGSGGRWQVDPT